MPRRHGILVVVALVLGMLAIGAAPASAAPADGSYITCKQDTESTKPTYIVVGGSPIWVRSWAAMGKWTTNSPHPTPTPNVDCSTLRLHPKDGTFLRGWKAGAATGSTYEIVGGAPITVHAWTHLGHTSSSHPTVEKVDAASVPAAGASPVTKDGSMAIQGYIASVPADGATFGGYSTSAKAVTTHYQVDSLAHPWPRSAAASKETVVDQTSINACERMNCDPSGVIVNEYGAGDGVLHVDGWAADYPSPASVRVQLSLGGSAYVIAADRPTNYVAAGTAGNHGFSVNLSVVAGSYVLCGTVLGTAPGATIHPLGCSNVTVGGSAPGRVHRPRVKAKGAHRLVVYWKQPKTHGSPIAAYIVKTSTGKKKQVKASRHKLVLKHLHAGTRVHVKVRAINGVGAGRFSKSSKSVTVR